MSPAVKYTLGRLGLFAVCFTALLPVPLNLFVKMMVAFVLSAGLAGLAGSGQDAGTRVARNRDPMRHLDAFGACVLPRVSLAARRDR